MEVLQICFNAIYLLLINPLNLEFFFKIKENENSQNSKSIFILKGMMAYIIQKDCRIWSSLKQSTMHNRMSHSIHW
jgi:hypothetical protein